MAADQYLTLESGRETMKSATQMSTGSAQAGKVVATNDLGVLDLSLMPKEVLSNNIKRILASESLGQGKYVNITSQAASGGGFTAVARLADASNDRPAHGFVRKAWNAGETAEIFMEGGNDLLSGLRPGDRMYLGMAGASTSVAPSKATNPASVIHQLLGVAVGPSEIDTDIEEPIVL